MRILRNIVDQLTDKPSKQQIQKELNLIKGAWSIGNNELGSDDDFYSAHDILIDELSKIGTATEDYSTPADFILDRNSGDGSYIGIVCYRFCARVILAVRSAQSRFVYPFTVVLDCDDAEITIVDDGRIYGTADDSTGQTILKRFGFKE